jgi:hypothetical protein
MLQCGLEVRASAEPRGRAGRVVPLDLRRLLRVVRDRENLRPSREREHPHHIVPAPSVEARLHNLARVVEGFLRHGVRHVHHVDGADFVTAGRARGAGQPDGEQDHEHEAQHDGQDALLPGQVREAAPEGEEEQRREQHKPEHPRREQLVGDAFAHPAQGRVGSQQHVVPVRSEEPRTQRHDEKPPQDPLELAPHTVILR